MTTTHRDEFITVACEWCRQVEHLTPAEEKRAPSPFFCSDRCEDDFLAQQEAWDTAVAEGD